MLEKERSMKSILIEQSSRYEDDQDSRKEDFDSSDDEEIENPDLTGSFSVKNLEQGGDAEPDDKTIYSKMTNEQERIKVLEEQLKQEKVRRERLEKVVMKLAENK